MTQPQNLPVMNRNWGWFLLLGILLLGLGVAAISLSVFTTILTMIILGIVITVSGVIIFFDSFKYWRLEWGSFFVHMLFAFLYIVAGLMLINRPILGSISLTFVLGMFYAIVGIFRIIYSFTYKNSQWGWTLFNGFVSFLLGVLILMNWPAASLFIIGLFIGIDLIIVGWVYIMGALYAR